MRIRELQLDPQVVTLLEGEGLDSLYPPQEDAIKAGVLDGKNLVLASPTASGKTLVAEICILKHLLERNGKAIYLAPLRALASEKFKEFQRFSSIKKPSGEHLRIGISTGDYDSSDPWLGRYDIIISTNEKADSLLRHRAPWMNELSLVVADEIHLLTEHERGPTLEVVLTRLTEINPDIQMLALSATVRNADEVGQWLQAGSVTTDWRPVPLREGIYNLGQLQFNDGSSRAIQSGTKTPVLDIALDVLSSGGQALIFTETRRSAVEMGRKAALAVKPRLSKIEERSLNTTAERILSSGEKTRLGEALASQIASGAGFHHAGLTGPHRGIVETAFRDGRIKVLAATPTLAAGVNLPARTVIISSYERFESGHGRYPISVLEYKQFCGRAGRPKYDKYGESVLIARNQDEADWLMENYVIAQPEKLWSKLAVEKILRPHVLSTVAAGYAKTEEGLYEFFGRTFYAHQYGPRMIKGKIGEVLKFLAKEEMVVMEGRDLEASRFGKRVSELYIDPMSAVIIRDGLYNRAKRMTDFSLLHLISRTPDLAPRPRPRGSELDKLGVMAESQRDEIMGYAPNQFEDPIAYDVFLSELKASLVLSDWISEFTEDQILETRKVEPGDLLRLVQGTEWLVFAAQELARLFGHKDLLANMEMLRVRVSKGVEPELVKLVGLEGVGRVRARMMYSAGLKSIDDIKERSLTELTAIPTIGPSLAKRIKEQAGGLIKAEEWERARSTKPAEVEQQIMLTEYEDTE
ncbi:DEAD/DEAH box helicase [Candidatus Bathyarchaeota archaeon]|nr:MAG: DEAD/DEAH box helicase [Candidatus Bathyarchaeota archaeon]